MIQHALFPTLVGEEKYPDSDSFKKIFFENALKHFKDGYSMETTGNVDLHHDAAFSPFFNFVIATAKEYLTTIGQYTNLYRLNIVKTWLNVITEFHTPMHNHADAHLSFVYYIQIPKDLHKPIYFVNRDRPNDLFHGMTNNDVREWTPYNSETWSFTPSEGQMFMFPGKLYHQTGGYGNGQPDTPITTVDQFAPRRISLAGDILITYKEKAKRAYGIQPIENWRTYDV